MNNLPRAPPFIALVERLGKKGWTGRVAGFQLNSAQKAERRALRFGVIARGGTCVREGAGRKARAERVNRSIALIRECDGWGREKYGCDCDLRCLLLTREEGYTYVLNYACMDGRCRH